MHAAGLCWDLGRGSNGLPSGHALENALGIVDRIDMAVMLLDHLHRRAHLLGQEIDIHPLRKPERGVGMPKARNTSVTAMYQYGT
jgi:hypothetical protein